MEKLGPKRENCQFKVKFLTKTDLNMVNPMVIFTLICFLQELSVFGKFGPKY